MGTNRRRRALFCVLVATTALLPTTHATAGTVDVESLLLKDINAGRTGIGKRALALHIGLSAEARQHSSDMARSGDLNHDGFPQRPVNAAPDPSEKNGAPDDGFDLNGACENVAYRQVPRESEAQIAQGLYEQWLNSPPHKECMFDESFKHTVAGVGLVRASDGTYWATLVAVIDKTLPRAAKPKSKPPSFSGDDPCGGTVDAPALTGPTVVNLTAKDPEGQRVMMSASDLPSWASFKPAPGNPGRGTMTVAPTLLDWLGTTLGSAPTVVVTATDAGGAKAKCSIVLRPALL